MFEQRLALSTWSLHRLLGPLRWTVWDDEQRTQVVHTQPQPEELTLLELPRVAEEKGFRYLELCHFHYPSTDEAYLQQLKESFDASQVEYHTLLVDYGDISSPDEERRQSDLRYLRNWIDVAAKSGAKAVRIVAGEQPTGDQASITRSCESLRSLYAYGQERGVKVVTENFRELTASIASWSEVMKGAGPAMACIVDFGNFELAEKEEGIRYGTPHAHSIHAKPRYRADGSLDGEEFERMLAIVAEQNDTVPVTVIFDDEGDMWLGIRRIQERMLAFQR